MVVTKRLILMLCAALLCGVFVAACGDDDSGGGGGGSSSGSAESGATEGAKVIDPASADSAKGEVTYCQGKDTSGNAHYMIDEFNKKYGPDLKAKLVEFPASADEQRNQFIQRQQAKSGDCDVFSSDVIWTAEFASQKWLYDMTPYMEDKKAEYIEAPIETVTYDGKIWGAPESSDAGLLYYNTDKVKEVPATWQEVYKQAESEGGIVYQGAAYEGLTCDFLELFFGAGGEVLSEDGTKATIADGDAAVKALQFMVDGIKDGAAPKAVTTYMEPESLTAFQTGKYAYMRNWPYAYALNQKADEGQGQLRRRPAADVRGRREGRHPRRPQQRHLRVLEEPGRRAEADRAHRLAGDPEGVRGAVQAVAGPRGRLRRPGGQEGDPVRDAAPRGHHAGACPAGVAGLPADLAGDLQERQRGAVGSAVAGGRDEAGAGRHREGAVDLLGHG